MEKVFCRSAYNYDRDAASLEAGLACDDPSLTKQSFADEADINTIVRRFNLTGEMPSNVVVPQYGDFIGIYDYHSAMNVIAEAHEAFDSMPAEVRAKFQNDPGAFVDFCSDPANLADMRKLGLAVPEPSKDGSKDGTQSASVAPATEADSKPAEPARQ